MTIPFQDEPYSKWSIQYWATPIYFFWKDWWLSRPSGFWWLFSTGLFSLFVVVLLFIAPRIFHSYTLRNYERLLVAADKAEKWEQSELWLQKMIALGDKRPLLKYQLAIVSEKLHREAYAESLMRQIAEKEDFTPAHAWLAAKSLNANATPEQIDQAITHLKNAVDLNGEDYDLRIALADAYRRAGRLKEASIQLIPVVNRRPELHFALARIYAGLGDISGMKEQAADAEKYLREKSDKSPENEDLVEAVADSLVMQGKWKEALDLVSRRVLDVERLHWVRSRIHTAASNELMKTPETQLDAVRHLYQALEESPKNRDALVRLARLAPEIVRISPDDVEPIRKWMTQAYDAAPDDYELTALLGMLHMQPGGQLEEAEKLLQKASQKEPILLLDVAQIQEKLNKPAEREATLKSAVTQLHAKLDKPTEATYFALAEALSRLGQFREAEELLTGALQKTATPLLRAGLAQIYFRQAENRKEDSKERIQLLFSAVKIGEGHTPSEGALAEMALKNADDKSQIVASANDLITTGAAIRGGHMVLGVIAARESNWNDSAFHFEQALSSAPNDATLLNNLAWALAKRNGPGDAKRSIDLAEQAVARAPQSPDIRETRGLAWLVNREWPRAIHDFEFALKAFPERKHLHGLLAEAYRGVGNSDLAQKHAEMAK